VEEGTIVRVLHQTHRIPAGERAGMTQRLERRKSMRIVPIFLVATVLLLSGCTGIGPRTVVRDRFDYTTALSDSWKSQMLINMVKMRYGDAPIFLDVASVINSYEVSGAGSVGASWFQHSLPGPTSSQNLGASGTYANRPTITYNPVAGERFARTMMTPVPPSAVVSLIQAGYPADAVFRVLIQSINGVQNRYGGSAAAHPADPEFYPLIERMRRIQASGVIGLRVQKTNETVIVFRGRVDEKIEADILEVRKILGLDSQAREFKVVYGQVAENDREIALLSRSMIQVFMDLASCIDVPGAHLAENRVNPGLKDEVVGGIPVPPLFRVNSSSGRPDDAFVAVPYHNHWFWIDDKDLPSKRLFSFLMFIFTLVETGGKEGVPIVTIPVR
jgi:hypothetical protein